MKINGVEFDKNEIETIQETLEDYITHLCNMIEDEKEMCLGDEYLNILQCRLDKVSHASARFLKAIKK